jgi:peroxiredoxin/uncharacterized membrane protein YphA (DoxX/SURF4 family)
MGAALLVCRLALASVFAVAGLAKLADLAGSREAVAQFGVPERLTGVAGTVLPAVELAVAVALIPVASAPFAAVAAALLLASFIVAIANANLHGRAPECHCFGQVHSAPAGPAALVRNGGLLGVAGFIAIGGWNDAGISATHWVTRVASPWLVAIAAGAVIVALIGFQVWFSLQLLAQNGRTLERLEALEAMLGGARPAENPGVGLRVGAPAPDFDLEGTDGRRHTLRALRAGTRRLMLVFTDAACGPCQALLPLAADWQRRGLGLAVLASGDRERNGAKAAEHGLGLMLFQEDREVAEAYRVHGTPMAVVIDGDGLIASSTVAAAEAIAALADQLAPPTGHELAPPVVPVHQIPAPDPDPIGAAELGAPIPDLVLPDLDGREVSLRELYTDPTVAIFWNPQCAFCHQMLGGLRTLEREAPPGLPGLVLISAGEPEEVRAQGLRSPVLLDPDGRAAAAFGATGTPMAVLLSEDQVASPLAPGARTVFNLIDAATLAPR